MRRTFIALCGLLLVSISAGAARHLGADFSKEELAAQTFGGLTPLHGYWVNWTDVYFYQGTMDKLSAFLSAVEARKEAVVKIVLHAGTTKARSPWDKSEDRPSADWSFYTIHGSTQGPAPANAELQKLIPPTQVDIWVGGKIDLGKLKVPAKFELSAAKETDKSIEKFLAERKKPNP